MSYVEMVDRNPMIRIKNSYESLYYGVDSLDPEMDSAMKYGIQKAFSDRDLMLSDKDDTSGKLVGPDAYGFIMKHSFKIAYDNVVGEPPRDEYVSHMDREFDTFAKQHKNFYPELFDAFEEKYKGEPVDFMTEYERLLEDPSFNMNSPENDPQKNPDILIDMEKDFLKTQGMRESLDVFDQIELEGMSYYRPAEGAEIVSKREFKRVSDVNPRTTEPFDVLTDEQIDERYAEQFAAFEKSHSGGTVSDDEVAVTDDDYAFEEIDDDGFDL